MIMNFDDDDTAQVFGSRVRLPCTIGGRSLLYSFN